MATYAQASDLRNYVLVTLPETDEELERLLLRCESEIDNYLPLPYMNDIARKVVLADYEEITVRGIKNATCAQAEYHILMGEEFFIQGHIIPEGPDTNMTRKAPKIAPKAIQELVQGGLLKLTGTMGQVGGVPPAPWSPSMPRRTV